MTSNPPRSIEPKKNDQSAFENYKKSQQEKADSKKREEESKLQKQSSLQQSKSRTDNVVGDPDEFITEQTENALSNLKDQERVLITGDDILIEYVERLIKEI